MRVTTVESDAAASGHAAHNLADLPRARAVAARVDAFLGRRPRARPGATVVLDPPRSGAGADVVRAIVAAGPAQIVYVACDPVALARDLGTSSPSTAGALDRLDGLRPLPRTPTTSRRSRGSPRADTAARPQLGRANAPIGDADRRRRPALPSKQTSSGERGSRVVSIGAAVESATDLVRVAVVDDHESVRLGLLAACMREGYQFVDEGANVAELIGRLGGRDVDVVVLDLSSG